MRPILFVVPLFLLVSSLGCGPIVMIPGGALSGTATPPPNDWSFTDEIDTVQLETRPSDPYSVNVWAIAVDSAIYVVAGSGDETTWARNIAEDDRVRLRVDDAIYDLRATLANDDVSRDAFLAAAKRKYDFDPEGQDTSKAMLFRLDPR